MASYPMVSAHRVKETWTGTGTGTMTLDGAVTGFQSFAGIGDGNACVYMIEAVDGDGVPSGGWERGIGFYTAAGTTLARSVVLESSNSGSLVSFGAGTKNVFVVDATTKWTSYDSNVTANSGSWEEGVDVTVQAEHRLDGPDLLIRWRLTWAGAISSADEMYLSLPSSLGIAGDRMLSDQSTDSPFECSGRAVDAGAQWTNTIHAVYKDATRVQVLINNANPAHNAPWTWASGDKVHLTVRVPFALEV